MMLTGQVKSFREGSSPYETSFIHFYRGMLDTPILGNQLNWILPSCLFLCSIACLVLSQLNYEKKAVSVLKKLNAKIEALKGH